MHHIEKLIAQGEGLTIEFKRAKSELPSSLFETVCSFLNRNGGDIILGVNDRGEIEGIDPKHIQRIKKEIVNALNNPQLMNPPIFLIPEETIIHDQHLLHLHVFESSQVHSTRGKIYDRNEDGDFNVTSNTNLAANLYIRKQTIFTENKIFPYATINELRKDLIHRTRQMAVNRQPAHPWEDLSDIELLRSAQLFQTDYLTGKDGLTLAAILLFGRDDVILSALPYHKTDAICRIENIDRYDDRADVRTNLI